MWCALLRAGVGEGFLQGGPPPSQCGFTCYISGVACQAHDLGDLCTTLGYVDDLGETCTRPEGPVHDPGGPFTRPWGPFHDFSPQEIKDLWTTRTTSRTCT